MSYNCIKPQCGCSWWRLAWPRSSFPLLLLTRDQKKKKKWTQLSPKAATPCLPEPLSVSTAQCSLDHKWRRGLYAATQFHLTFVFSQMSRFQETISLYVLTWPGKDCYASLMAVFMSSSHVALVILCPNSSVCADKKLHWSGKYNNSAGTWILFIYFCSCLDLTHTLSLIHWLLCCDQKKSWKRWIYLTPPHTHFI